MIPFYASSQVEKVVISRGEHKYNIQELHGRIQESSINSMIEQLELNEVIDFLEYHYKQSEFKTIFISIIFANSFKRLDKEKKDLVVKWIEDKCKFNWTYLQPSKDYFRITRDRANPFFDAKKWYFILHEFSVGKGQTEFMKFLEYGKVMLHQEYDLHLVMCKDNYNCTNCDQLRLKIEKLNLFFTDLTDKINSNKKPENRQVVENKIVWKGTQKN